jgi:hypothetical protein
MAASAADAQTTVPDLGSNINIVMGNGGTHPQMSDEFAERYGECLRYGGHCCLFDDMWRD